MAVTVQMQFESVVTEIYQDAFVGSSIENGTTIIQFDLRKHNFHQELGTQATLCWRKESYHPMVLVSDKPSYNIGGLQTKFGSVIQVMLQPWSGCNGR
jgi:hypothetical protein